MRILIDIGHPAHVHYFRNFIKIMERRNHKLLIISRDKEITHYLLKSSNIPFVDRGKGRTSLTGKAFYYFKAIYIIFWESIKFKSDLLLSFGSPYTSFVSKIINKPHVIFNDTEHAKLSHLLSDTFAKAILTPSCYKKDLGEKHIRFNGYMELCYLHPKIFKPNSSILDLLGMTKDEKFVILRFVSWNASHDVGHSGLSVEMKRKSVKELSKYAKVFISSEGELPDDLKKYQIKIQPEKIHEVLYFASLYFGESGTMASESALLGTPSINISTSASYIGVFSEISMHELMYVLPDEEKALSKAIEIIQNNSSKKNAIVKRDCLVSEKINVTNFMVWFIENFPESPKILKENNNYQNNFK